jgi:hypothetical protein
MLEEQEAAGGSRQKAFGFRKGMVRIGRSPDPVEGGGNVAEGTPAKTPLDRFADLEAKKQITGDTGHLRERLSSTDKATRLGAEAELIELESQVASGEKPVVRGGAAGSDQPTYEVKARTEPFTSEKNAQNFFNDRIKAGNAQFFKNGVTGEVRINLGENTTINGKPITVEVAKQLVKKALSKGGRGTKVTRVIVKDAAGKVIYSGLGD